MTGEKQHRQFWVELVHVLEKAQSVHVGHPNVTDDNPLEFTRYMPYRFRPTQKGLNIKAGQFESLNLRVEKILIVIDQDDASGHFGILIVGDCHGCIFFNLTRNVAPNAELS
jgi:hypothetical protein